MKLLPEELFVVPNKKGIVIYHGKASVPKTRRESAVCLVDYMLDQKEPLINIVMNLREQQTRDISVIERQTKEIQELNETLSSIPGFTKQNRYKDDPDAEMDYIDKTYRDYPFFQWIAAMRWTIGKYFDRFGKKDDIVAESFKIADYAVRFHLKVKEHVETEKRKLQIHE